MMYLFDKELRLIDIIGRDDIISFYYEREKNGLYFIEAVLPLSKSDKDGYVNLHKRISKATYVGHYDKNNRFQMHRTIVLEIENDEIFLRGVHLFFDEAKAFGVVKERTFKDAEISHIATYLFEPIGWKMHSFDPSPTRSIKFSDISVLEARKNIIELYGFEFDYWFDFDGQKITDKWYTIKKQIGKETHKRYQYGSNALKVRAEEDYSEVYTAVIGKGALLEPIEREAAQKKYEAEKKQVEAERERIKAEYQKAKAAHEAARKSVLAKYEADVAAWRKVRDGIVAQRKARAKRPKVKGQKLPKLPKLVVPKKPSYPKAKPAPKQGTLPKLPVRPDDAKAPSKDDPKDERRIEFTNVVWQKPTKPLDKPKGSRVLVDPVTTDIYGYRDESGKRVPKTAVVVFEDEADPAKVLSLSYTWLKENNRPKAVFSVEVDDAEELELGDTVHVIYKEANQVVDSRVFKVRDDLIADMRSVEFGDGEHFGMNSKEIKLGKDIDSLKNRVNDELYARKVAFDTEFDRQVRFMKETYDEALADAIIEVEALAEKITLEIDTAQEDFIDDVEAAIHVAEIDAEERAEEFEEMIATEIATQREELTAKITQSYTEAETAAKEAATTAAKEMTDAIATEVTKLEGNVASLTNETSDAKSTALRVSNELIQAKKELEEVSKWKGLHGTAIEQAIEDYKAKIWQKDIDAIEIGTRNLFRDSKNIRMLPNNTGLGDASQNADLSWTVNPAADKIVSVYAWLNPHMYFPTVVGETYTLSLDVIPETDTVIRLRSTEGDMVTFDGKSGVNMRVSTTFTVKTDFPYFSLDSMTAGKKVTYDNLKLEKGTKASDWSPAPEDIVNRLTSNEAEIQTTKDEISKRVLKSDFDSKTNTMQVQLNKTTDTANRHTQEITEVKGNIGSIEQWQASKGVVLDRTADAVTQKVWQKDIDDLNIGGRNLLVGSSDFIILSNNNINYPINMTASKEGIGAIQRTNVSSYPKTLSTYTTLFFPVEKTGTYIQQIKVRPSSDIKLMFYGVETSTLCKANEWTTLYRVLTFTQLPGDKRFRFMGVNATENDFSINNPIIEYKDAKVEYGNKATDWTPAPEDVESKIVTVEQTANAAKVQAETIGKDYVKQSGISVASDGILIGSKKIGGSNLASAIAVTPGSVDIITKAMRISGDMTVAGDIKSLSLQAVNADIANLRSKILVADSITANALKVDTALADKLFATDILTKKIVADTTYSNSVKALAVQAARADIGWLKANVLSANSVNTTALQANSVSSEKLLVDSAFVDKLMANTALVDSIKAKSLDATYASLGNIRASMLQAGVIRAVHLSTDVAMIDKLFADDALVSRLTSKTAFIRDIKAIELTADRIRGGVLRSQNSEISWDLNGNTLDFHGTAAINFKSEGNVLKFKNNDGVAFLSFTTTVNTTSPTMVLGANRNGTVDPKRGDFAGFVARALADPYTSTDIIADMVTFDSHGSGSTNTGGWTLENFRTGGSKYRAFYGNNTGGGYVYELGQRGFVFNMVWVKRIGPSITVQQSDEQGLLEFKGYGSGGGIGGSPSSSDTIFKYKGKWWGIGNSLETAGVKFV